MEESDILDFDRLLAPISEDAPVGVDPRQDISVNSLYLKMKDARSEARRLERAMDTDGDGPSADPFWENVLLASFTFPGLKFSKSPQWSLSVRPVGVEPALFSFAGRRFIH